MCIRNAEAALMLTMLLSMSSGFGVQKTTHSVWRYPQGGSLCSRWALIAPTGPITATHVTVK